MLLRFIYVNMFEFNLLFFNCCIMFYLDFYLCKGVGDLKKEFCLNIIEISLLSLRRDWN